MSFLRLNKDGIGKYDGENQIISLSNGQFTDDNLNEILYLIQINKNTIYQGSMKKQREKVLFIRRHLPLEISLSKGAKYVNLGDWIEYYTYGVFDGENLELKEYSKS